MPNARPHKSVLDKDLDKVTFVETASLHVYRRLLAPGLGVVFVGLSMLYAARYALGQASPLVLILAAALAGYMAMNIGANDVTNNTGAAVGARAISMRQALGMAALFEILGAVIGGRDVTATISSGIVPPTAFASPALLTATMMAALTAAALWINLATWLNAPVSTTHSIIGAIIGATIALAGIEMVEWTVIAHIVVSWIVSPLLGGLIAAGLLFFIEEKILSRDDKIAAARLWVPILIGVMAGAFAAYIALQFAVRGKLAESAILPTGLVLGLVVWGLGVPYVRHRSVGLENRNGSLRILFQLPLIAASALLCFAHGANDVSNAIGPLAAIVSAAGKASASGENVPFWALMIGAFGISTGLLLFGPRLIRLVGEQITKLNPVRSYCVSLSAALTVLSASWAGLPVSSTHIAVGSVFGVGFFREWYVNHWRPAVPKSGTARKLQAAHEIDQENAEELRRRILVRRSHFMTIAGAWMITLPVSGGIAALLALACKALFL
nr:anion permease [uncultured Gellertiella sp.]